MSPRFARVRRNCSIDNMTTLGCSRPCDCDFYMIDPENAAAGLIASPRGHMPSSSTARHFVAVSRSPQFVRRNGPPTHSSEMLFFEPCNECMNDPSARAVHMCHVVGLVRIPEELLAHSIGGGATSTCQQFGVCETNEIAVRQWEAVRKTNLRHRAEHVAGVIVC
eukprot:comp30858_c0_seq1/m.47246 comp30858_c0_seq1/g.47246  ORF comp30858_c0_seq1/g.47246 comp30858_c0_seq1/m.47246 type:complete len:165 (-) comp30858_c0_seq1:452-946(-)